MILKRNLRQILLLLLPPLHTLPPPSIKTWFLPNPRFIHGGGAGTALTDHVVSRYRTCSYMRGRTYAYTGAYTYGHVRTRSYTYVHSQSHTFTYVYVRTRYVPHVPARTYTHLHVRTRTCAYAHVRAHTCTHVHIRMRAKQTSATRSLKGVPFLGWHLWAFCVQLRRITLRILGLQAI